MISVLMTATLFLFAVAAALAAFAKAERTVAAVLRESQALLSPLLKKTIHVM